MHVSQEHDDTMPINATQHRSINASQENITLHIGDTQSGASFSVFVYDIFYSIQLILSAGRN